MKTKIFFSTALTLAVSAMLTSCAFLQRSEFAQKKYTNFHVAKHSVEGIGTEHATISSIPPVTNELIVPTTAAKNETAVASANKTASSPALEAKQEKPSAKSVTAIGNKIKNETPSVKRKDIAKTVREIAKHSPSSSSDGMLIVELILAIFISPLAVFVHKGDVSKWFWIDLLLWLFSGVIWFGVRYPGPGGLLWAAAVVIAICYVLGVIRS